ncbi:MAG: M28 family metallopeptidase [Bacteroidetes bacterium]|nr:M28 family metallopeptidase [Bacteroidota bacterium]
MKRILLLVLFFVIASDFSFARQAESSQDVSAYQVTADRIIDAALADSAAWDRLAHLTDTFGPRFSGSPNLELAIDWILEEMKADGLENVRGESVMVPRWVRGEESLQILTPHNRKLQILGLGGTVGTGPKGITAEVFVVNSYDDLEANKAKAVGKIVLWNVAFTNYGATGAYRRNGAVKAAQAGAIASLVRSITPTSLYTPHTGSSTYEEGTVKIPHAAVTIEDAMMMQRMQDRGQKITVRLMLDDVTLPDVPSRNVVAELVGSEFPDEVIVFGGHIDSWDVGTGAMDDAGGCVAAWEALRIMKKLGLRPKRTIRVVMWTNEENGTRGGNGYRDAHLSELDNHILAMESDGGVFAPIGFGFTGSEAAFTTITEVGKLLNRINAGTITKGGGGADIGPIMALGVPGMGLNVDGSKYFDYHHTNADYVDKLNPVEVAKSVATMGVMAFVVADMPQRLPR